MTSTTTLNLHRALDEAFAAAPPGAPTQDLKEEVRASLLARSAALEAAGADPGTAARTALDELGDLREIVATLDHPATDAAPPDLAVERLLHRVRPRPAYVLRTTALGIVVAGAATLLALVAVGVLGWSITVGALAVPVLALGAGTLVADALRQETTSSYALPTGRALGFGAASTATGAALGLAALVVAAPPLTWAVVAGAVLLVGGVLAFVALGTTATNRHKPWVLDEHRRAAAGNRFEQEPDAAARFGIYVSALGFAALLVFALLTLTVGLRWSWLALAVAVPAVFLLLARMLFPAPRA
ncbi:permease prefix domain 1-containing protein [Cellulomonas triticagri]|uniref:Uncharacterized protein n=1 Tax=Cellulomonas triticagri TaxID=2483352 RepID=A0A3M2JQ75_9CELL|nr:permease prefix domain 1-containing protein [Cellulomonas triticagri]RMI12875.1 hypothetical protein EBM89_06765 [Cellulomonas triticagri]